MSTPSSLKMQILINSHKFSMSHDVSRHKYLTFKFQEAKPQPDGNHGITYANMHLRFEMKCHPANHTLAFFMICMVNKIQFNIVNHSLVIHSICFVQKYKPQICKVLKLVKFILLCGYLFRSYTFDIQVFCNDDGCLLPYSYCSVIGVSSYIGWCNTAVYTEEIRYLTNSSKRILR